MTCKIERLVSGENSVVIRVCGRIQLEHVSTVKDLIRQEQGVVVLDLTEVILVDREAVNLIATCTLKNIELRNCPAFLRDWVAKERRRVATDTANEAPGAANRVDDV
jgi:anti-anti-sigma regulatory factor